MVHSGLYVIEDALIELVKYGKTVLITAIPKQPLYMMERVGIIPNLIPRANIFEGFNACLKWIKENVENES